MTVTVIDARALGAILGSIFYGIYVVLFILYMVFQCHNHRAAGSLLTLAQIGLFALCTIAFCLDISSDYFSVVPDVVNEDLSDDLEAASMVIFSIIDCLAQIIILYRCWIVWGRRWIVVAVPGFLALVSLGGGLALVGVSFSPPQMTDQEVERLCISMGIMSSSVSLAVKALATLLLVTKILLVAREVHLGSDSNLQRSLRIATAMLIESGLLMLAPQLVFVVLFAKSTPRVDSIYGLAIQMNGITPTLLSLRIFMGSVYTKTAEETKTHSLRFTRPQGVATQTTDSSVSISGVQSQVIDIELDEISDSKRAAEATV